MYTVNALHIVQHSLPETTPWAI